jgi:hypothetical protein
MKHLPCFIDLSKEEMHQLYQPYLCKHICYHSGKVNSLSTKKYFSLVELQEGILNFL